LFAYLFGSHARSAAGVLSDIDVAVYLDKGEDVFRCRLRLTETIMKAIKSEDVDVVVLNNATPLLRYEAVKNGIVIKEDVEKRHQFEVETLRDYLDTAHLRNTQLSYDRDKIRAGTYFG
jgi:hypothetical protein